MIHPTDPGIWQGRRDGDGPDHARWYTAIGRPGDDVGLVGFACDLGVRRNQGRPGAALGPDAIRRVLAPMALHRDLGITDAGDVRPDGADLEGAQRVLGTAVSGLLDTHRLVVVLGGGHEVAYGSYLGRIDCARLRTARVGVLNLDAHFDLRDAERATSGTPFRQMAAADRAAGREFSYAVVGIAEWANTRVLFRAARELGVRYLPDSECQLAQLPTVVGFVEEFVAGVDAVHLSVDLDVLPAAVAPGVSAPAAWGVPLGVVHAVCRAVVASGKLALLDIAELSPPFDIDLRTARVAAGLVHVLAGAGRAGD